MTGNQFDELTVTFPRQEWKQRALEALEMSHSLTRGVHHKMAGFFSSGYINHYLRKIAAQPFKANSICLDDFSCMAC